MQSAQTLKYASVGYMRYNWSDIEPTEGRYTWSRIDSEMRAWTVLGKRFAFGVMNANSSTPTNPYVTPKWVFEDGAVAVKSWTFDQILKRQGIQYIPVWNNPIFLRKVQDFVDALAHRYDGNPAIAFIDVRSYGNWGIGVVNGLPHSQPLSVKDDLTHIQMYRNAFKQTQLIVPWGSPAYTRNYSWAVNQHMGLRRDGIIMNSDGHELLAAFGKAPIVFEFYGTYQWLSRTGHWENAKLINAVEIGRPSYINLGQWGNDGQVMLTEQPQLVQDLANMMGYHFVLSRAILPNTITNRQANLMSFSWKNLGVASLYQSARVAVALLNRSNTVVQKQWLPGVQPQNWTPGKTVTTRTAVTFQGIRAGTYNLAVGLFAHPSEKAPTFLIGNKGKTNEGWYIVGREPVK